MTEEVALIQVNPFPPTAVANRGLVESVSLLTDPLREARSVAESFSDGQSQNGLVVAVIGDFGSGKTHLALDVLLRVEALSDDSKTIHVDAPGDSFLSLYRERFLSHFTSGEFRERISRFYSRVVADEIGDQDLLAGVRAEVGKGLKDPEKLLNAFGLPIADYREALAERLASISPDRKFATALALMLRPDFEPLVWDWLHGHEPDMALRERGIDAALTSDQDALDAIGIFAMTYSQGGAKFALVLDELEKVLSDGVSSSELRESSGALKRLMEVFAKTGSLLLLCGLPDYYNILPEDVQQRISSVIHPAPLNSQDVKAYVDAVLDGDRVRSNTTTVFTDEATRAIAQIADGNARRVVRLCRASYDVVAELGQDVSVAAVRTAARKIFDTSSLADVRADVVAVLDQNGLVFALAKQLSNGRLNAADIWVEAGQSSNREFGVAVTFAQALLEPNQVSSLVAKGKALRKTLSGRGLTFLVSSGIMQADYRKALEGAFDRVFATHDVDYLTSLEGGLKAGLSTLGRKAGLPTQEVIASSLQQIVRQNTNLRKTLDAVQNEISDPMRYREAAAAGVKSVFGQLATASGGYSDQRLLTGRVGHVLDRSRATLDEFWAEAMVVVSEVMGADVQARRSTLHDASEMLGVVAALRAIIEWAENSLVSVLGARSGRVVRPMRIMPRRLGSVEEIEFICRSLDHSMEALLSTRITGTDFARSRVSLVDLSALGASLFSACMADLEASDVTDQRLV